MYKVPFDVLANVEGHPVIINKRRADGWTLHWLEDQATYYVPMLGSIHLGMSSRQAEPYEAPGVDIHAIDTSKTIPNHPVLFLASNGSEYPGVDTPPLFHQKIVHEATRDSRPGIRIGVFQPQEHLVYRMKREEASRTPPQNAQEYLIYRMKSEEAYRTAILNRLGLLSRARMKSPRFDEACREQRWVVVARVAWQVMTEEEKEEVQREFDKSTN